MSDNKNNIILIGMPTSGKSTIGVILAKILGYRFIDADIVIQEKEGRKLSRIIAEDGVDGFIDIESRINSEINADKTVIATGGSVVYGKEAMEHYKEIGTVVYLKVSFETLKKRLHHAKQRGVVMKDGQTLESLYEERKALYEQYADITVDEGRDSLEKVIEKVSGYFSDN
ncbi:MAG: shikimate kinase [Butyrivibrio sp.]|uniref:shikimate kinase n=1 Tax=Butyrivibrio sp. TaxID=28121 RepID=UPI001B530F9E|nr:shikimate kinase [Butyrivibrio sp.]MBP3782127.1 shikimate kinase [Butyrivibrio sp.]